MSDSDTSSSEDEMNDDGLRELETLPSGKKNIKHAAAKMIVEMRSVSAMTRVGVRRAMSGASLLVRANNFNLKADVTRVLERANLHNGAAARVLLRKFDNAAPFKGMLSNKGQISGISQFYSYIAPQAVMVDPHMDVRNRNNVDVQLQVPSSYQYVSIIEVLKLVLSKENVMAYIRTRVPDDDILSSFTDSDQFKRSQFFQQHPHAFQLGLYFDDVDPARRGPKEGIHSLANFVVKILNMPPWLNSLLAAYHPVVLAYTSDCKDTFSGVLGRFVNEVQRLENGVRVFVNGQFEMLYATLVAVFADTKAAHEVLGLLAAGARHFCRQCMISRQELHAGQIMFGEPRTPALSDAQLARVQRNAAHSTECGLRYRTCLHDLQHFRMEDNCNFDLMHDGPEGVIAMVLRLCLMQFIVVDEVMSCDDLNRRIFAFRYGHQSKKDKPSPNFTLDSLRNAATVHALKQNAAQTLVLMRAMPFLLDGMDIAEDDDHYNYMLLLSRIYELANAPRIPRTALAVLQRELYMLWRGWYVLFPDIPPINKFHQKMHLVQNTLEKGPQRNFSCFRGEGKNCPIKRHVAVCNNFINPPKTSMQQAQVAQAKVWGTPGGDIVRDIKFYRRSRVNVRDCIPLLLSTCLQALGFAPGDELVFANSVLFNGFSYKEGEDVDGDAFLGLTEKILNENFSGITYGQKNALLKQQKLLCGRTIVAIDPLTINIDTEESVQVEQQGNFTYLVCNEANNSGVFISQSILKPAAVPQKETCKVRPEPENYDLVEPLDILTILSRHEKGKKVISYVKENGYLNYTHKVNMMQLIVDYVTKDLEDDPLRYYPTTSTKLAIARGIVKAFPALADDGKSSYDSWYNLKTGYGIVQTKFNTMRASLSSDEKKNKVQSESSPSPKKKPKKGKQKCSALASEEEPSDADLKEKKRLLNETMEDAKNKAIIILGLKETYKSRRAWIRDDKPSFTEIVREYRHLLSFSGEMLSLEFQLMEPLHEEFIPKLSRLAPLILQYAQLKKEVVLEEAKSLYCNEIVQAISILHKLLPSSLGKNSASAQQLADIKFNKQLLDSIPCPALIQVAPTGTDAKAYESIEKPARPEQFCPINPYILWLTNDYRGGDLYIKIDSVAFYIGSHVEEINESESTALMKALAHLVQSHHVFNLEYHPFLKQVYQFLETVYSINSSPSTSVKTFLSSIREMSKRM